MQTAKPIDMPRPTFNDIRQYEIENVKANKYMDQEDKDRVIAKLRSEMTKGKEES